MEPFILIVVVYEAVEKFSGGDGAARAVRHGVTAVGYLGIDLFTQIIVEFEDTVSSTSSV